MLSRKAAWGRERGQEGRRGLSRPTAAFLARSSPGAGSRRPRRCGCTCESWRTSPCSDGSRNPPTVPAPGLSVQGGAPLPLAGIRVLDFTHALAGPHCTMLLGDLGADRVKIQPPARDPSRPWGPPFLDGEASCLL